MQNKNILVLGLGATGLSLLKFLLGKGAVVSGYDTNLDEEKKQTIKNQFPEVSLISGDFEALNLNSYDVLASSPGIPVTEKILKFKAQGKEVVGDVELFAREVKRTDAKVIAITGSNGKSTVTSLVGFLCEKAGLKTVVAGNIGLPVLDAWKENKAQSVDVWVLELSSFQLDTTSSLEASAACVLNISEDHLDRYSDLLDYAHSKSRIFSGSGVQVLNLDDLFCRAMARAGREIRYFSLLQQTDYWVDTESLPISLFEGKEKIIEASHLPIQGLHNASNVLAAFALCASIGLNKTQLLTHLQEFKGLAHRVEKVGEKSGIQFIDDSKGTNVGATCAALNGSLNPVVLIAGGDGKGQDFSPLKPVIEEKVRAVFLIGQDAKKIAQACEGIQTPIYFCDSLEEATVKAYEVAHSGDVVLLSPACASWGMFRNYAHRSEVFIKTFDGLEEKHVQK